MEASGLSAVLRIRARLRVSDKLCHRPKLVRTVNVPPALTVFGLRASCVLRVENLVGTPIQAHDRFTRHRPTASGAFDAQPFTFDGLLSGFNSFGLRPTCIVSAPRHMLRGRGREGKRVGGRERVGEGREGLGK